MLQKFFSFAANMLSDGDQPSTSRGLSWTFGICACVWLTRLVWHNSVLPDAVTLGGLTAFVAAPYAINRFSQK